MYFANVTVTYYIFYKETLFHILAPVHRLIQAEVGRQRRKSCCVLTALTELVHGAVVDCAALSGG